MVGINNFNSIEAILKETFIGKTFFILSVSQRSCWSVCVVQCDHGQLLSIVPIKISIKWLLLKYINEYLEWSKKEKDGILP